jgi:hypothetical protein
VPPNIKRFCRERGSDTHTSTRRPALILRAQPARLSHLWPHTPTQYPHTYTHTHTQIHVRTHSSIICAVKRNTNKKKGARSHTVFTIPYGILTRYLLNLPIFFHGQYLSLLIKLCKKLTLSLLLLVCKVRASSAVYIKMRDGARK